jgi:hypothetical protein
VSITGWCPREECGEEIEFDGGAQVSGPGIRPYIEVLAVISRGDCKCDLTEDELDRARESAERNRIAYLTEREYD